MRILFEKIPGQLTVKSPAPVSDAKYVSLSVIKEDDSPAEIARKQKCIKAQEFLFAVMAEGELTEADWLTFIIMKSIPDGVPFRIVEDSAILSSREFRDAWKDVEGRVEVDMPKARVIHMGRIREARNKELDKSDKNVLRELGAGREVFSMEIKRQELRDIPQKLNLDIIDTPEDLGKVWPATLPNV